MKSMRLTPTDSVLWVLQTDQYIHRILVEEDANVAKGSFNKLCDASSEAGKKLYTKGDFMESGITDLDAYILKKVSGNYEY